MSYTDDERILIAYGIIDRNFLLNPFTGEEVKIDRRRKNYKLLMCKGKV